MNWKFWQKNKNDGNSSGPKVARLAKPRELPDRVGRYLVTQLNEDPDWVWSLKCVMRLEPDKKNVFEIRIFNPATTASRGVPVANFNSLDLHPDMILFFGSFNKNTDEVLLEKTLKSAA